MVSAIKAGLTNMIGYRPNMTVYLFTSQLMFRGRINIRQVLIPACFGGGGVDLTLWWLLPGQAVPAVA